jgi:hypothetical protein
MLPLLIGLPLLAAWGCFISYATYRRWPFIVDSHFHQIVAFRYGERFAIGYAYAIGIGMAVMCSTIFVFLILVVI